jgi:hypothetical protein
MNLEIIKSRSKIPDQIFLKMSKTMVAEAVNGHQSSSGLDNADENVRRV